MDSQLWDRKPELSEVKNLQDGKANRLLLTNEFLELSRPKLLQEGIETSYLSARSDSEKNYDGRREKRNTKDGKKT